MFSRKDTAKSLSDRDYQNFLANRGLEESSHSRLLFTLESFNIDQTPHHIASGEHESPAGQVNDDVERVLEQLPSQMASSVSANETNAGQRELPSTETLHDGRQPASTDPAPSHESGAEDNTSSDDPRRRESILESLIAEPSLSASLRETMRAYLRETTVQKPTHNQVEFDLPHILDTVGTSQLDAARERVTSLNFSTEQLRKACGNNIRHFEISYHATLGAVFGLLNRAVSHGVDMSLTNNKLRILPRYKSNTTPLAAEDIQILELVNAAWERFMKACCALALAEAALKAEAGHESNEKSLENHEHSVSNEVPAAAGLSAPTPSTSNSQVDTEAASSSEAENHAAFLGRVDVFNSRLDELNTRVAEYLARRDWEK
ncbi:hypothetical protein EKO04_006336 [Ascochyta lentis]|uniref:Uncharacterized protein n=1 Tax=Ascochyta lentis TaxID=205686 RepID=A0A8H7J262_9PLEO|nr:hypothetical protein EKO04_006336 [Ascochyta lentis]